MKKKSFLIGFVLMAVLIGGFFIIFAPLHHGQPRGENINTLAKISCLAHVISEYHLESGIIETNRLVLELKSSAMTNIMKQILDQMNESIWEDSWSNHFYFTVDSNAQWFLVGSFGPDGKQSQDDIVQSNSFIDGVWRSIMVRGDSAEKKPRENDLNPGADDQSGE